MVQIVDTSPREVPKLDAHGVGLVDENGLAITEIGPHPYFNNLDKSMWANTDEMVTLKLISTEIFQSVNPGFVVLLTPLVVAFFAFLRKRSKEPSTPAKIGWGMFITAVSTLVMIGAVFASQNGLEKSLTFLADRQLCGHYRRRIIFKSDGSFPRIETQPAPYHFPADGRLVSCHVDW